MTAVCLCALQALTNLSLASAGPGLPPGWALQRTKGVQPPSFEVTRARTLRIDVLAGAGFARYRLRAPLLPRAGALTWRWRTGTPLRDAALRQRTRDDAPVRVYVVFDDGRRAVIVLERAEDADGSWHMERRDPFADYRVAFNRASRALVAVGAGADTHRLKGRAVAEVSELTWELGARP
ncbi:MAG: hypothetical protein AUH12_03455 [Gemmatimonadetes bacterium 13_2_20CM_69_8]|nr:MAG: hypothetical protein AUH12_03455 [Gemmatimonadetes bacterium 13_2_20CM_69_8]